MRSRRPAQRSRKRQRTYNGVAAARLARPGGGGRVLPSATPPRIPTDPVRHCAPRARWAGHGGTRSKARPRTQSTNARTATMRA